MKHLSWVAGLAVLTAGFFLLSPVQVSAGQSKYVVPPVLAIAIGQEPAKGEGVLCTLLTSLEARVGTLKNLLIRFETSPDIRVEKLETSLPALSEPERKTIALIVRSTGGPAGELGPWVRVRVEYLPDYPVLEKLLENTASYPVETERNRLLDMVKDNMKNHVVQIESTRYFLK